MSEEPPPRSGGFIFPPSSGRGILYQSTRGARRDVSFEDCVLSGLAPDKGLYVPQEVPRIPPEQLEKVSRANSIHACKHHYHQVLHAFAMG